MDLTVIVLLLIGLVVSATVCIFLRDLLKTSIAMALVSAILATIMFLMDAHLAAVFELSVCAGLITVILISAVSMTRRRNKEEWTEYGRQRRRRFAYLPVLLIVLIAGILFTLWPHLNELIPYVERATNAAAEPDIFWNKRKADLLGQVIVILAGVYGVLIFFKEREGA